MAHVQVLFDCGHEQAVDVSVDDDVEIPERVRGLGKCTHCTGELNVIPVSGITPKPGGREVVLDSIMLMPI